MAKQTLRNIHRLINTATKQLPPNETFVADLKTTIEKMALAEGRKPSQSYKPSSMICLRNMYFQLVGEEADDERSSAELIGMGESGTDRHERIQNAVNQMKDYGMDCIYIDVEDYIKDHNIDWLEIVSKTGFETKLKHKYLNLSFLCDGIILYKGEYYILEIKTETLYKWQPRTDVAEEHIAQGTTYSVCFGIDKVMFLYENRDNCSKKAYILNITEDMKYEHVISKIEEVDSYADKLIPPPYPTEIPKKTCNYCKYKKACAKAGR